MCAPRFWHIPISPFISMCCSLPLLFSLHRFVSNCECECSYIQHIHIPYIFRTNPFESCRLSCNVLSHQWHKINKSKLCTNSWKTAISINFTWSKGKHFSDSYLRLFCTILKHKIFDSIKWKCSSARACARASSKVSHRKHNRFIAQANTHRICQRYRCTQSIEYLQHKC